MEEKRKYKRLPVTLNLDVSEVFKQDNDVIKDLDAEIHVFDISKNGIGFTTQSFIPEGYYFNATILLGKSEQKIMTVIKILRRTQIEDNLYRYGCEFTGFAHIFDSVFDEYAEFLNSEEK